MDKERIGATVAFLFSAAAFTYASVAFPPASAMFPQLVTGLMTILSVLWFARSAVAARNGADPGPFFRHPRHFGIALVGFVAYVIGVDVLGYFTASLIFIPAIGYVLGFRKHLTVALSTVIFLGIIYLVFVVIFERPMPPELLLTMGG